MTMSNSDSWEPSAKVASLPPPAVAKKKRNLPGMPDLDTEVIALSPRRLMATNRFVCEICNKGSNAIKTSNSTGEAITSHGNSDRERTKM
ncbi:hypothetical protein ZOSMA_128G00350 [Zostera marina]|uniref:Uncharacterized protein n=1 Tax=Zostera marina TaxID=29655 RepID=A0A0K9Q1Z3_ZOSMR|nr:hypothetical protein ZOSMA_128G00350 [Zostera marina]